MVRWVVPLLGIALLLPSANLQRFDGLPLSSPLEFAALVLLVPLLTSRALRRLHAQRLQRGGSWVPRALSIVVPLAIGLKVILLISGVHSGFLACYGTPLHPAPGGACERSFENPFARFGATRIDRRVDFEPGTWNLGFINSLRFNFYPWVSGLPRRDRLPMTATWRGVVAQSEPWVARVTYVGEGTVTLAGGTLVLPARYGPPNTVELPVPAGRNAIVVRYRFDDGARTGQPNPPFSYAQVRLGRQRAHGGEGRVEAARPALAWRLVAAVCDSLIGLTLVMLAGFYACLLTPTGWLVALGGALGAGTLAGGVGAVSREQLDLMLLLAVMAVVLIGWPRGRILLAGYFVVAAVSIFTAGRRVNTLGTVLYRSAGDDWLTYESYARAVLETWSLRGGEDVFYYQPLFRYVRFGQRLLLGDGDLLVFAAGFGALLFGVFWSVARLTPRRRLSAARTACTLGLGLLLLMLVSSNSVTRDILAPLSEPVTWTALLFLFPLLVTGRSGRAWWTGATLAGLSIATRPNQAPGTLLLVLVCLANLVPRRPRAALVAASLFLTAALLPLAHNLYYGGEWILFTNARSIDVALARPAALLGRAPGGRIVTLAWADIRLLLLLGPLPSLQMRLPACGLLLAWLVAAGATVRAWPRAPWPAVTLMALPALYLSVYLVFEVRDYFPRHLIIAYLAMGLVGVYVASGRGWRATAPKGRLTA
jgi:hypothetical protein